MIKNARALVVSFFCFWAFFATAQEKSDIPTPQISCAIKNDKIIPFDGSICQDDIALNMLSEMFPSLYGLLAGTLSLDFFSLDKDPLSSPGALGNYIGSPVMESSYSLFHSVTMVFFVLYAAFVFFYAVFRWAQGDDLMDQDGGKDSVQTWGLGGALGVFLLIPVKGSIYAGTVIVFLCSILSLFIANFIAGTFLSFQESIFDTSMQITDVNPSSSLLVDRHDYLSDHYYRYLVRMDVCRQESSTFLLTKIQGRLETANNAQIAMRCLQGGSGAILSKSPSGQFVSVSTKGRQTTLNDKWQMADVGNVDFGLNISQSGECQIVSQDTSGYQCGSIEFHEPDYGSNALLPLFENEMFVENKLSDIAASLSATMSANEINRLVNAGWISIKTEIDKSMRTIASARVSVELTNSLSEIDSQKIFAQQMLIEDANADAIRQLSRFYHQSVFNILMLGRATSRQDMSSWFDSPDPQVVSSRLQNLNHYVSVSKKLSLLSRRLQCLSQLQSLAPSSSFSDFIKGNISSLPDGAYAKCLDIDTGDVLEFQEIKSLSSLEVQPHIEKRTREVRAELASEWSKAVGELAKKRAAIEDSFNSSVDDLERVNWWHQMRQQGYLALANYSRMFNQKISGYKRDLRLMTNHFSIGTPSYDASYLGAGIARGDSLNNVFTDSVVLDNQINIQQQSGKPIDPLVERYHWLSQQEQILRQPKLQQGTVFDLSQALSVVSSPVDSLARLGMNIKGDKDLVKCMDSPEHCPFPLTDPMIELSMLGHDMLDSGIAFYTLAAGAKGVLSLAQHASNKSEGGGIEQRSSVDGALQKTKKTASLGLSMLNSFSNIFDVVFQLLGTIMAFYIAIGAFLAYVLPLIPFMFMYLSYISWVMVLLMSSFAVLMWSFFWLRFRENREIIKRAGLQYGIELSFRPVFSLISVLFAMSFFYVSTFVVSMSIGMLMEMPLAGEGGFGLRAFTDPLMMVLIIGWVYFTIIKHGYKIMDEMIEELLLKLGIRRKREQDQLSDTMKAVLFDGLKSKISEMHDSFNGDKKLQELTERRNRASPSIDAARKAMNS